MKNYLENTGPARDVVRACTICKVYWVTTVRSAWGGRRSICYESAKSFHPSLEAAVDAAESMRARGSAFVIHELPALYLPFESVVGRRPSRRGLVVVEVNTETPLACCGTVAIDTREAQPIADMFLIRGSDFTTLEAASDMPVLAGDLRQWVSSACGVRSMLGWSEIVKATDRDLSHIESLCMRLSQQVRDLQRCTRSETA
jgi:hypothetical protein